MSRTAAEKISLLERTLARVQQIAAGPRAKTVASSVTVIPSPSGRVMTRDFEAIPLPSAASAQVAPAIDAPVAVSPLPPVAAVTPTPTPVPVIDTLAASAAAELAARKDLTTAPPPATPTSEMEELDEEDVVPVSQSRAQHDADELEELPENAVTSTNVIAAKDAPPSTRRPEPPAESIVQVSSPPTPAVERNSTRPPPASESLDWADAPAADDLEADVPVRVQPPVPSDAQLGATIELEEGPSQSFELAPAADPKLTEAPHEQEEVLPAAQAPGRFSGEMAAVRLVDAPPVAAVTKEVIAPSEDRPTPVPEAPPPSVPRPRSVPPVAAAAKLSVPSSPPPAALPRSAPPPAPLAVEVAAQVFSRPQLSGEAARFVEASQKAAPSTFGELLDQALSLGS